MQHTTGYSSGEFEVDQVFNSKSYLQEVAKIYSIKAHQDYVFIILWLVHLDLCHS